jgi:hypothetical protein
MCSARAICEMTKTREGLKLVRVQKRIGARLSTSVIKIE